MTTHLTVTEAAASLNIHPSRVRQLAQALGCAKSGRAYTITPEQVEQMRERRTAAEWYAEMKAKPIKLGRKKQ